jgi:hypothetical protein
MGDETEEEEDDDHSTDDPISAFSSFHMVDDDDVAENHHVDYPKDDGASVYSPFQMIDLDKPVDDATAIAEQVDEKPTLPDLGQPTSQTVAPPHSLDLSARQPTIFAEAPDVMRVSNSPPSTVVTLADRFPSQTRSAFAKQEYFATPSPMFDRSLKSMYEELVGDVKMPPPQLSYGVSAQLMPRAAQPYAGIVPYTQDSLGLDCWLPQQYNQPCVFQSGAIDAIDPSQSGLYMQPSISSDYTPTFPGQEFHSILP